MPLGGGGTFYTRYGDWFGWLAIVGALVVFGFGAVVTFRKGAP